MSTKPKSLLHHCALAVVEQKVAEALTETISA
jgi:hypothetical protein